MKFLSEIPTEIWVSIIAVIMVIYNGPFFLLNRKREILIYKLMNVYIPIQKEYETLYYAEAVDETFRSIQNKIEDIINEHYAYCPSKLIHSSYNLKSETFLSKTWIDSFLLIMELVFYENFYCQSKLKFDEMYEYQFKDYKGIILIFKKFMKTIDPFTSWILLLNIFLSVINAFYEITHPWFPGIVNSLICVFFFIDFALTKKTEKQKIEKQKGKVPNPNHS